MKTPPTPSPDGMKYCWKCQQHLPTANFYPALRNKCKLQGPCKSCKAAYTHANYIKRQALKPAKPRLPDGMKRCPKCREVKMLDDFNRHHANPDGLYSYCKLCARANTRAYVELNQERLKVYRKERWAQSSPEDRQRHLAACRRRNAKLRAQIWQRYGLCCTCCGEPNPAFLTLDHIANDGAQERKALLAIYKGIGGGGGLHFYAILRKRGFPDGYQTLCFNCNVGKHVAGGCCPHQLQVRALIESAGVPIV